MLLYAFLPETLTFLHHLMNFNCRGPNYRNYQSSTIFYHGEINLLQDNSEIKFEAYVEVDLTKQS